MPVCTQCNRHFASKLALHAHCTDKSDHPYCEECECLFSNFTSLQQHHTNSPLHIEESDSDSSDDDTYCEACDKDFADPHALYQHLRDSPLHNWCFVCKRDFKRPGDLNKHNASRVHKVADKKCPLCKRMFKSPSDMADHIESGCHRNLNVTRHHVAAAVHQLEIKPPISLRQITGSDAPTTFVVTAYVATQMAFNGRGYECYLCHREFRTLLALNQHLNSPAHDNVQFKCPHSKCGKQFKVISALIRHIESESCGLAKFQTVENYANQLTAQFSRLLTL